MSDVTAGMLDGEREDARRPGFVRVFFFVFVGVLLGAFLGTVALGAPSYVGIAAADSLSEHTLPFALGSQGAALADVAVAVALLWAITLTVRYWLRSFVGGTPAWTWTALTLLVAGLAAALTPLTVGGATALAAIAARWTIYRADGTSRPEPFTLALSRRWALAVSLLVPVLAIGTATAYAMYHPLVDHSEDAALRLSAGTSTVRVIGPPIYNSGGSAVKILAIEPGVEHGYALHLANVETLPEAGSMADRRPFAPFTLQPKDATYSSLVLELSRAGCRPGTSGRIESLRVRYVLGGERTALVRLGQPITLDC